MDFKICGYVKPVCNAFNFAADFLGEDYYAIAKNTMIFSVVFASLGFFIKQLYHHCTRKKVVLPKDNERQKYVEKHISLTAEERNRLREIAKEKHEGFIKIDWHGWHGKVEEEEEEENIVFNGSMYKNEKVKVENKEVPLPEYVKEYNKRVENLVGIEKSKFLFSNAVIKMSFDLLSFLRQKGNVCVSPTCLMTLLTSIFKESIERRDLPKLFRILGIEDIPEEHIRNFAQNFIKNPGEGISLANAHVFVDTSGELYYEQKHWGKVIGDYQNIIFKNYDAKSFLATPGFDPRQIINEINEWGEEKTNGLIKNAGSGLRIPTKTDLPQSQSVTSIFLTALYSNFQWPVAFNHNWSNEERELLGVLFNVEGESSESYRHKYKQERAEKIKKDPEFRKKWLCINGLLKGDHTHFYPEMFKGTCYEDFSGPYFSGISAGTNLKGMSEFQDNLDTRINRPPPQRVLSLKEDVLLSCIQNASKQDAINSEEYVESLNCCKKLVAEFLFEEFVKTYVAQEVLCKDLVEKTEFLKSSGFKDKDIVFFEFVRDYSDYLIEALNGRYMDFETADGQKKRVFGLEKKFEAKGGSTCRHFRDDKNGFEIVAIPYKEEFSSEAVLVKPLEGQSIEKIEKLLQKEGFFAAAVKKAKSKEMFLQLPVVSFNKDEGIAIAKFLPGLNALESSILVKKAIITKMKIKQFTKLYINKEGTEGASVTRAMFTVEGYGMGSHPGITNVCMNRPFIGAVIQKKDNKFLPLYIFRVTNTEILKAAPLPRKNQ